MKISLNMEIKIPTCTYGNVTPRPTVEIDEAEVEAVFEEFREDLVEAMKEDPEVKLLVDGDNIDDLSNYRKLMLLSRYLIIKQFVDFREDLSRAANEYQEVTGNSLFEITKNDKK